MRYDITKHSIIDKKSGSLWFSGGKGIPFFFSVLSVSKPKAPNSHWIGPVIIQSNPRKGILLYPHRIVFLCLPPEC